MKKEDKFDTPNWAISFGEKTQEVAVRGLVNLIAGSRSPAYRQAKWFQVDQFVDESGRLASLPIAEADPKSTFSTVLVPRFKKKAAVAGSGRLTMHDVLFEKGYPDVSPVVAYIYNGVPHAGTLPNGIEDLGWTPPYWYTAAFRAGRSDFGVGIGAYVPSEKAVIIPADSRIIEQNIAISDLPDEYPGTPLV